MIFDHTLFKSYKLNPTGQEKVAKVRAMFEDFHQQLKAELGSEIEGPTTNVMAAAGARARAIVATKLEEAGLYAVKAVALHPGNQENTETNESKEN